jgi:hypothetical protein
MKVLIRRCRTGEYLATVETWARAVDLAYDFRRPEEALGFAQQFGLTEVEVVLRYEWPVSETVLTVPKNGREPR